MKRLSFMSLLFVFAVTLAVGSPNTHVIDEATVKTEMVVEMPDASIEVAYQAQVADAIKTEALVYTIIPSVAIEIPYVHPQKSVLKGVDSKNHGPPKIRFL